MKYLEAAIKCSREALSLQPPDHPHRFATLIELVDQHSTRFLRSGRIEDLDGAIAYSRDALALHPPGHSHRGARLERLADLISERFKQLGRTEDMEEMIRLDSEAENIIHANCARLGFRYHPGPSRR
jgi:hypothetical protein